MLEAPLLCKDSNHRRWLRRGDNANVQLRIEIHAAGPIPTADFSTTGFTAPPAPAFSG